MPGASTVVVTAALGGVLTGGLALFAFGSLQREVDRLFEDFARGVPALGTMQTNGNLIPSIDVSETDKEIERPRGE
jgi:hypothetical protein